MSTLDELWKAVDDAWDALIEIERRADHVAATEEMSAQIERELRLAETRYRAARNALDAAERAEQERRVAEDAAR